MATQETEAAIGRPLDRPAGTFSDVFERISAQRRARHPGQARGHRARAALPRRRGPPADRGRARRRQDQPGQGAGRARSTARSARVQFTPDLLPSDVVGVTVWNRGDGDVRVPARPVFANIVLGDEINRASPKTQSALLEAMAERPGHRRRHDLPARPAVHGHRHPEPDRARGHLPAAREPARPLPHARLASATPTATPSSRSSTPTATHDALDDIRPVATAADVRAMIARGATVHVAPSLKGYLVDLADATPPPPRRSRSACRRGPRSACSARPGPGPRRRAATTCVPDDIKALAEPVLAPPPAASPPRPSSRASTPARSSPTSSAACRCPPDERVIRRARRTAMLHPAGLGRRSAPAGVLVVAGRAVRHPRAVRPRRGARRPRCRRRSSRCTPAPAPRRRTRACTRRGSTPARRAASSCGSTQPRPPAHARAAAARPGVGHPRRAAARRPARAPASRPAPPTGCPTDARGASSRIGPLDVRVADPFGLTAVTTAAATARPSSPSTPRSTRSAAPPDAWATTRTPAPSTRTRSAARGGLLRAAPLRRRRRPAPRALAVDRPPRRAHGPPGRAAVAGPGHRAARRPPRRPTPPELARAGCLGGGQHRHRVLAPAGPGPAGHHRRRRLRVRRPATPHVEAIMEYLAMVSLSGTRIDAVGARVAARTAGGGGALVVVVAERPDRGDGRVRPVAAAVLVRHGCCVR